MLETLRAFGLDRLTEAGERPGAEAMLALHMLAVAERAAAGMAASATWSGTGRPGRSTRPRFRVGGPASAPCPGCRLS
jgi:hypothetical protein